MKDQLTPEDQELLQKFIQADATMRKYQKQFFNGKKSIQRTAMYWENQSDNYRILVMQRLGIELPKEAETKNPDLFT